MIILWSDHGSHLGEKDHLEKFALWEKTTHIPLIIVDPRCADSAGKTCSSPLDLTVIYPTLVELCGLPANPANDGVSVAPQVRDPSRPMSRPALMTGLRPDSIKMWGLNKHFRDEKPDLITLPQYFKQKGYYTHAIGKVYHGRGRPSKDPPSWSDEPEFDPFEKVDNYFLEKNRTGGKAAATERAEVADNHYRDGKIADAAIRRTW